MNLLYSKPYTSSNRNFINISYFNLSKKRPAKCLLRHNQRAKGRNNQGKITIRHKGGGHKRLYRKIDFHRNKYKILGRVLSIEYDPNRTANIALIAYEDSEKRYILCPLGLQIGDWVYSVNNNYASLIETFSIGSSLPLKYIPFGTEIHNIEINPGKGGQIIKAAGCEAKIVAKSKNFVAVKLCSKTVKLFKEMCCATIGRVGNLYFSRIKLGKAGRSRWLGIRPTVRGSAMNPIDHPHGGGEGKSPIGRPSPVTPWGKPAFGFKSLKKKSKKRAKFLINFN